VSVPVRWLSHVMARRSFVGRLLLGLLPISACGGPSWLSKQRPVEAPLPRRLVIMVWKSARVHAVDDEGFADAVATMLQVALGELGYEATILPLAGHPRLPRIELAFWDIDYGNGGLMRDPYGGMAQGSVTVDCAFVTARNQVAFVGRVRAQGEDGNLGVGAEAAARAIADMLVYG
jgi:hypothetical protein